MRKYIIFMSVAALSVLYSCKKENANSTPASSISLSAYIEDTEKTYLEPNGVKMTWSENDEIRVFKNNGSIYAEGEDYIHDFAIDNDTAGSKHGRFYPKGEYIEEKAPKKGWWAYYPTDWKKVIPSDYPGGGYETRMLFSLRGLGEQEYGQNVGELLPMIGVLTQDNEVKFKHTCGIIRFRIGNPNAHKLNRIGLEYTGESAFKASVTAETMDMSQENIQWYKRYFTENPEIFEYEPIMKEITYAVNSNDEEIIVDMVAPPTSAEDEETIDKERTRIVAHVKVTFYMDDAADVVFGEDNDKSIIVTPGHILPISVSL